jgi:hypothetical protein
MSAFNRVAWIAGAVIVILSGWSALTSQAVLAQMHVALMRNVDEPGLNPYQVGFITACPNGACDLEFPQVPAGKRLVVKYVSVASGGTAELTTDAVDAPMIWLTSQSQDVHFIVDAGQKPVIHINGLDKVGATVVGYFVSIP